MTEDELMTLKNWLTRSYELATAFACKAQEDKKPGVAQRYGGIAAFATETLNYIAELEMFGVDA